MPGGSRSLPVRPSLRFLKLEAKRRLGTGEFTSLHEAQAGIAREHGLPSCAGLKQACTLPPEPESHALDQLRWVVSRFSGADAPGWTAPDEAELSQHFDDRVLAVIPAGTLVEQVSKMAADLRAELVVISQRPVTRPPCIAGAGWKPWRCCAAACATAGPMWCWPAGRSPSSPSTTASSIHGPTRRQARQASQKAKKAKGDEQHVPALRSLPSPVMTSTVMTEAGTIEVDGLTKRYGPLTALDNLSFTVRPGHVTGFLGPNGAGKTTTMRIILGLAAPTSGRALVGGRRYDALIRPLLQVGSLLDATALHGGRTAWTHLASVARSNGIGRPRVTEVLRLTGLEAVANRRVKGYSLGMKQRLGIAAALLGDPPVLMFDEPVNGLDPEGVRWIRGFFRELASQGRTVLVSSHLMTEMAQTADHLIIIGRGRLLADLPTTALIESSDRGDVLVRSPRTAELAGLLATRGATIARQDDGALAVTGLDAAAIGDLAAARGIALHALVPRQASLEDAYLDLTGESTDYRGDTGAPQ